MYSENLLRALKFLSDGRYDQARSALQAIRNGASSETSAAARYLAHLDILERKYAQAIATLERACKDLGPDPRTLTQLAEITMQLGDYAGAIDCASRAIALGADDPVLRLNLANWQASRSQDPLAIRQAYEAWCRDCLDPLAQEQSPLQVLDSRKDRKLKIGYVSGDLKNHAVRYFIEPYFKHHDRNGFEIHAFMTEPSDAITGILKEHVEHWHDVQSLSIGSLLDLIRSTGIDVLVDLSGHTAGGRLEVFARRAAPVQVTWWGFVQTLGMRAMDYRLTDWTFCPPGTEAHYTERLCRMSCMTAYEPPVNCDALYDSPWKRNGYVTMVSLNHSRKVSNQVLLLWREILQANPNCGLIIVTAEGSQEGADALFHPRLRQLDMPMDRVSIVPKLNMLGFMSLASVADFSLDSMPISGGVTTFHALWMGLPVLTARPPQPIALCAYTANILQMTGLDACIADSEEDLVRRASAWIRDPNQLDDLRSRCRQSLVDSPFMDHGARVRELEQHFVRMWNDYVDAASAGDSTG